MDHYVLIDTLYMRTIQPEQLKALRHNGCEYALFDVRDSAEAHRDHIFGATFLPRRTLAPRIRGLVSRRDTPIVVYDGGDGDTRAALATAVLQRYGYVNVLQLANGLAAWRACGEETFKGSNLPSKWFGESVQESAQVPRMQGSELYNNLVEGRSYRIFDIRSPEEFTRSRIPGAMGLFGTDLAWAAEDLVQERLPVVVHCSGRTRSIIACQSLRLMGVPSVYALENGTMGWRLNGYPLEQGPASRDFTSTETSRRKGCEKTMRLACQAGVKRVDANTLMQWQVEAQDGRLNLYLLDVRQLPEYAEGHLPGSLALPGGLAIQRTDEFIAVRTAKVVLIDDDETRASLAAYWLCAMGLPEVMVLKGGLNAWKAEGKLLSSGRGRASLPDAHEAAAVIEKVTPREVVAASSKTLLIYVDTQTRFLACRPPQARWVAFGHLEQTLSELRNEYPTKKIVLVAESESLAMTAALNVYLSGTQGVCVLEGGMATWRLEGLVLKSGPTAEVPVVQDVVVQPYDAGYVAMRDYLDWEEALTDRQFPSLPGYMHYGSFIKQLQVKGIAIL